jgi:hypothetical protein
MTWRYQSIYPAAIQLETRRRQLVEEIALRDALEAPRRARVRRATRRLLGAETVRPL